MMVIATKNRTPDIHTVMSHLLCVFSWSLTNIDGTGKETNKTALVKHLENTVVLIQNIHGENHILRGI